MDFGNWGRDPRGFRARDGTEQLRGLVLANWPKLQRAGYIGRLRKLMSKEDKPCN